MEDKTTKRANIVEFNYKQKNINYINVFNDKIGVADISFLKIKQHPMI